MSYLICFVMMIFGDAFADWKKKEKQNVGRRKQHMYVGSKKRRN